MAVNSINCIKQSPFNIDFNGNPINSGEYWVTMDNPSDLFKTSRECVETTSNVDQPGADWFATQQYTNCYDCISNNNGLIGFENCFGGVLQRLFVDVSAFTESQYSEIFSIISGRTEEILSLEFIMNGTLQKGCYSPSEIFTPSTDKYQVISLELQSIGQQIVNTLTYTAQTNCETCLTATSFVYLVKECTTGENNYVYLPQGLEDHLISYTDGINEFCGDVIGSIEDFVPTYTFLTDYGFKTKCSVCLENVNKRVLIQNCSDEEDQVIVWASQLFGLGQASNLEINGGCYEIIGETTDPVTQSGFLDFEPHAGCESCLTCNGVNYVYARCEEPLDPAGVIRTNQILPIGYNFYNPLPDQCCIILNQTTQTADFIYPSVQECVCDSQPPTTNVFVAFECLTGKGFQIQTSDNVVPGNFVKILYGETEYLCVEIADPDLNADVPTYNTVRDINGDTIIYNDCEECIGNRKIGVRTVNCDTQELQIVDIPYSAYTQLLEPILGESIFSCFVDSNDFCRTVVELCPQPLSNNVVTPVDEYFSCPTCRAFNPIPPEPPRSAGTEVFVCEICCECGATGSTITQVSPPHPVWTDGYGTAVTQLNMITLGGPNGLNN